MTTPNQNQSAVARVEAMPTTWENRTLASSYATVPKEEAIKLATELDSANGKLNRLSQEAMTTPSQTPMPVDTAIKRLLNEVEINSPASESDGYDKFLEDIKLVCRELQSLQQQHDQLKLTLKSIEADKARLDWLEARKINLCSTLYPDPNDSSKHKVGYNCDGNFIAPTIREAIDGRRLAIDSAMSPTT